MTEQEMPVYRVVNAGVDSLWLNVCYGVGDDLETIIPDRRPVEDTALIEKLLAYQEVARAAEQPVPTDYEFGGSCLLMYGNGGGMRSPWRFILRNAALELKIGMGKRNGLIAKVRLSAEYLWSERDLLGCIYAVHCFLLGVFDTSVYLQVSRVDLCADVEGYDFGSGNWQDGFIRRCGVQPHFKLHEEWDKDESEGDDSDERDDDRLLPGIEDEDETAADDDATIVGPDTVHMRYRPITGFSFGSRKSPMSAIIYNKSNYIKYKKRDTSWFHDLWRANGCEDVSAVWRIEFHLTREALHAMSVESAYELPLRLTALWEYCSINWLRYAVPSADSNRTRWAAHAVWEVVQHAYYEEQSYESIEMGPVIRERKRAVNEEAMVAQIVGCLATKHAWRSGKRLCEDDVSIALHEFAHDASAYLTERMKDFTEQVRKKQQLYSLVGSAAA